MKSSIIERLIICWNVLTKRNYIYFGVGRNPIIWNEDGTFKETKKSEIKSYVYIDEQYVFNTNDEGDKDDNEQEKPEDEGCDAQGKSLGGEPISFQRYPHVDSGLQQGLEARH